MVFSYYDHFAQSISASPYSVYGIGVIKGRTSALNRSLSGTGIGIKDAFNFNNLNPASYTSINTASHIFEMGFFFESDYYQTSQESAKSSTGNLTGLNYWFRFTKSWAGTVGLAPFSSVSYNVASSRRLGDQSGSTVHYTGSGGISQFYFGNGFQLTRNLSIGVNGSFIFGSLEKTETLSSGSASGTSLEEKTFVNKFNADFGALYTFYLNKGKSISYGLTYNPGIKLNTTTSNLIYNASTGDTLLTESQNIKDYTLPLQIGSGMSFQTKRSTIAADVSYQEWSKANLADNINLKNTLRYSIGYEYKGNPAANTYWDIIQWRTGLYMQENYLVLANTSPLDWGFTLGMGLPVTRNRSLLNISYQYNQSGTIRNNLIKQQAHVIVLDITFRDIWGIKKQYD